MHQLKRRPPSGKSAGRSAAKIPSMASIRPGSLLIHSGSGLAFQGKLRIGAPGDKYEQEADRVAEQVMRMPEPTVQPKPPLSPRSESASTTPPFPGRDGLYPKGTGGMFFESNPAEPVHSRPPSIADSLQAKSIAGQTTPSRPLVQPGNYFPVEAGQPLSSATRAFFEPRFGADLSRVRVHSSRAAAQVARSLRARALTAGNHIFFGQSEYSPETSRGRNLIAHELVHTFQQAGDMIRRQADICEAGPAEEAVCYGDAELESGDVCEFPQSDEELICEDIFHPDNLYQYVGQYVNQKARVKASRGIRLHASPSPDDAAYRQKLSPADRVYRQWAWVDIVAVDDPGKSIHSQWALIKTSDGNEGWIERTHLTTERNVRDPRVWKYYVVKPGEKLGRIIQQYYYAETGLIKYGQDERAIAEAFVLLNENSTENPIAFLGTYERSFFKDTLLDASMEKARRIYNEAQLIKYRLLKFPTSDYIQQLIAEGKISKRADWKNSAFEIGRSVQGFINGVPEGFADAAVGTVKGLWSMVKIIFSGEIIDQAKTLYTQVRDLGWRGILNLLQEIFLKQIMALEKFIKGVNPLKKWWAIGKIVGMVLFEIVLAIFTAGAVAAGRHLAKAGRVAKAMERVKKIKSKIPGIRRIFDKSRDSLEKLPLSRKKKLVNKVEGKDDLNIEKAFREDAPFEVSEMKVKERMRRARSTQRVPSFDDLNLTPSQWRAVRKISGQDLDAGFRKAWRSIIDSNPRAQREMAEVQRLINSNRLEEARKLSREVYNRARSRFWRKVRNDRELRGKLEEAGLKFSGSRGSAPYWEFPDGHRERLTLEHKSRVTDLPTRAVDADNFQFVPFRENVNTLEWIRGAEVF